MPSQSLAGTDVSALRSLAPQSPIPTSSTFKPNLQGTSFVFPPGHRDAFTTVATHALDVLRRVFVCTPWLGWLLTLLRDVLVQPVCRVLVFLFFVSFRLFPQRINLVLPVRRVLRISISLSICLCAPVAQMLRRVGYNAIALGYLLLSKCHIHDSRRD